MSEPSDYIDDGWDFVNKYNEYLAEMADGGGGLAPVPATELAWMIAHLLHEKNLPPPPNNAKVSGSSTEEE